MFTLPEFLSEKDFFELEEILKETNHNITDALDIFLKRYPNLKDKRARLAAVLSWYKKLNKIPKVRIEKITDTHKELLELVNGKLKQEKYRTIIIGNGIGRLPDIIAFRKNKIFQVEVETIERSKEYLQDKVDKQYDDIMFFIMNTSTLNWR